MIGIMVFKKPRSGAFCCAKSSLENARRSVVNSRIWALRAKNVPLRSRQSVIAWMHEPTHSMMALKKIAYRKSATPITTRPITPQSITMKPSK